MRVALACGIDGKTRVDWAPTLSRAVASLREQVASLILLDCNLPDSTGLASFEAVLAKSPRTPIVT